MLKIMMISLIGVCAPSAVFCLARLWHAAIIKFRHGDWPREHEIYGPEFDDIERPA